MPTVKYVSPDGHDILVCMTSNEFNELFGGLDPEVGSQHVMPLVSARVRELRRAMGRADALCAALELASSEAAGK